MDSPIDIVDASLDEESSSSRRIDLRDLGEYRLLKRLGTGGMGHVYKAMHRRLERLVAIKVLPDHRADDPLALARFDREIKAAGRLSHPNLVQAFDAQEIDGTRFLVMEFIDGVNLSLLVRTCGPLRIADACELVRQAALGLQAAHERGLVHRDIKPSNLMLSRSEQVKVLDLGLARFRAEPLEAEEMTAIGETIGTAEYIAPEQVGDSHRVDIRADIYSLGCAMYRLLTGQPPFYGAKYRSSVEKMMAHVKEPLPSIRQLRREVSESLAGIIEHMTAKNPDDRFGTPTEVAAALAPHTAGNDLAELMRRFDAGERAVVPYDCVREPSLSPGRAGEVAGGKNPLQQSSAAVPSVWKTTKYRLAISAVSLGLLMLLFLAVAEWLPHSVGAAPHGTLVSLSAKPDSHRRIDMCGRALPRDEWVDMLPCVDLERDRTSGSCESRSDGVGCRGTSGYPRIAVPVCIHGDYDMEVEFTRNSGDGLIRILFPVGDRNGAQLLLGSGDRTLYGLNECNGHKMTDSENPTATRLPPLVSGRRYRVAIGVRLSGTTATIDARLNGAPLFHCTAPFTAFPAFSFPGSIERARPAIGVEAGSDATFHAVRMRLLSGTAAVRPRRLTEPCPSAQWVDLLSCVDIARDTLAGAIHRKGSEVVLEGSGAMGALMLPAAVTGSYELAVEFTRNATTSSIAFILPVGSRRVRVNIDTEGELHPEPWSINRPAKCVIEEATRHVLWLKVYVAEPQASIDVRLDDKPWLSWSGRVVELHDGPIALAETDRIGFVANGVVTLHAARLRMISGKGSFLPHEPAAPR